MILSTSEMILVFLYVGVGGIQVSILAWLYVTELGTRWAPNGK
jgi:hypothetical protein